MAIRAACLPSEGVPLLPSCGFVLASPKGSFWTSLCMDVFLAAQPNLSSLFFDISVFELLLQGDTRIRNTRAAFTVWVASSHLCILCSRYTSAIYWTICFA